MREFYLEPAWAYCDVRGNLLMAGREYVIDGLWYILLRDPDGNKCSFYRGQWYGNNLYDPESYGEKLLIEDREHDYYNPWRLLDVYPYKEGECAK